MDQGALLLELQDVDLAIARAERELEEMPEKKAILEVRGKLKELEALKARADAGLRAAEAEVSRLEDEVAAVESKAQGEQEKMMSGRVSDPKEVANLSRELDALERKKDKLEDEELSAMVARDEAAARVDKVAAVMKDGSAKEATLLERFQVKGTQLKKDAVRLGRRRGEIVAQLPAELARDYELARDAKHGIAVGSLRSGRCTACRVELPAERVQALEAKGEIAKCPKCRRMLVVGMDGS